MSPLITCLADGSAHESLEAMHKHLQFKVKVRQADYYTRYHPRADRLTGEPIPFKSVDQYLAAEFLSKDTLRRWIAANPEAGRQWSIDWLKRRKEEKNLTHAPSQVELRSLLCPSMHYYEHGCKGGYEATCRELGYAIRFDCTMEDFSAARLACAQGGKILIDTREQSPFKLAAPTERATLPYGDYALDAEHTEGIHIERKSLNDFASTLSDRVIARQRETDSAFARFGRELERAKEAGVYIVMLVENTIDNALELGTPASHIPTRGKVTGAHLFHNLRDLLHRFDHFQALFVAGRTQAATAVVKLLSMGDTVKHIDLQFSYESGRLKL